MTQHDRIERFVHVLHDWYVDHRRDLPWRDLWDLSQSDRAYRVWISEVMLQQTQVARVVGSYKKFIQEFPTVRDLARASNRDVLIAWRGMGYNSRALRLRDGAKEIVTKYDANFPHDPADLIAIKGIGAYTAGAIRTFAFDLPTPVIDTNIRRILHRTFVGPEKRDGTWIANDQQLLSLMQKVLAMWSAAGYRGSDLLSALMDYGSLVQTKTNPKWDLCVLTSAGIMKTKRQGFAGAFRRDARRVRRFKKIEPGRMVGATFVPNRIFRGRIVDVLRDHPNGMKLEEIGNWISPDYSEKLRPWLKNLIKKLAQEKMVQVGKGKYVLAE